MSWEEHAVQVLPPDAPRAQWLAARRLGLGASDIRVLMGCGYAEESLYKLLAEKTTEVRDAKPNIRMRRGNHAEEFIAREFEAATGQMCVRAGLWRSRQNPIFQCTPDWRVGDSGMESKNLDNYGFASAYRDSDEVPRRFYWQMLACIYITGAEGWWLAMDSPYYAELELRYVDARDPAVDSDINLMLEEGTRFWQNHVVAGFELDGDTPRVAPEVELKDDAVEATMPQMVRDALQRREVLKYPGTKAGKKELEDIDKFLESQIGGHKTLELEGVPVLRWQSRTNPAGVDWEALEQALPGAKQKYSIPGTRSRFLKAIETRGE